MGIIFRMPSITGTDHEQLSKLRSYFYQFIPQLQFAFDEHEKTLKKLVATPNYVSEIGKMDEWEYRRWKSGAIDINGSVKVIPETESTMGSSGVYRSKTIYLTLPFNVEKVRFSVSPSSNDCLVGNMRSASGNDNQIAFNLYRFTDFSDLSGESISVDILASGFLRK